MVAATMLYSCQDNFEEAASEETINATAGAADASITPSNATVRNGRLYFDSQDQLKSYYQSLETTLDEHPGEEPVIFEEWEAGYLSLREKLEKEEVTEIYDDGSTRFAEDYVLDDIRKSVLNEFAEVQVGDAVYVYFTENHVFEIPASDAQSLENFRNVEKRNGSEIPVDLLTPGIKLHSSTATLGWLQMDGGKIASDKTSGTHAEYIDFNYQFVLLSNNINCEVYEKSFFFKIQRMEVVMDDNGTPAYTGDDFPTGTVTFTDIPADFTIDFQDGNTGNYPNVNSVNITHTFASLGTFNPVVTATFDDPSFFQVGRTETATYGNIIVSGACSQANQSYNPWIYSNNKAMEAKIWFKNDFFGTHAGAKTISYRKKSNGSHVRDRAYVYAEINATFRNNNCQALSNKRNTKDCNNCKDKTSKVHSILNYDRKDNSNGDIFSEHEVRNDGVVLKLNLVLNPC